MNRNAVNKHKTLSKFLSARLSEQEWKHFKEILRNYGIHKSSVSAQLRALLRFELYRSRRYARRKRELMMEIERRKRLEHSLNIGVDF